eukprot:363984-Chlamydomonas_euryale.AAC.23
MPGRVASSCTHCRSVSARGTCACRRLERVDAVRPPAATATAEPKRAATCRVPPPSQFTPENAPDSPPNAPPTLALALRATGEVRPPTTCHLGGLAPCEPLPWPLPTRRLPNPSLCGQLRPPGIAAAAPGRSTPTPPSAQQLLNGLSASAQRGTERLVWGRKDGTAHAAGALASSTSGLKRRYAMQPGCGALAHYLKLGLADG